MTIHTNKFSLIATAETTQDVEVFTKRYMNFITELFNTLIKDGNLPRRMSPDDPFGLMSAFTAESNRLIEELAEAVQVTNDLNFNGSLTPSDDIDGDEAINVLGALLTGLHNTPLEVLRKTKSIDIHISMFAEEGAHGYPLVSECISPKGGVPVILYVKIQCTGHSNECREVPDNVVPLIK